MEILRADKIEIQGEFWKNRQTMAYDEMSIRQFRILNGEIEIEGLPKSHCVENFRILVGDSQGEFVGHWFADHDLFKWLEGAIYAYHATHNPELKEIFDYVYNLLSRAQCEDGYLNTYYTLKEPNKRWTNFTVGHELLCAGNLIEAGVAEKYLLGEERFFNIAVRYADCIYDMVKSADKKIYDGHEEIEIALIKLYFATGNEKYLELGETFINSRGDGECLFLGEEAYKSFPFPLTYFQAHAPVREQKEAVGHAVRAMYLYTAMAELAYVRGDKQLYNCAKTLYENMVKKRMYVTCGIGSEHYGERFTVDYDLPSNHGYNETCAEVGLMMFCRALLKNEPSVEVADIMEKTLYNGLLSGVSQDGRKYFYVNPLSVIPEISSFRVDMNLTYKERVEWMDCPCCPPNVFRLFASLGEYVYTYDEKSVYLNLLISSWAKLPGGTVTVKTNEPYSDRVEISFPDGLTETYFLKIPYWAAGYRVETSGAQYKEKDGYLMLSKIGKGAKVTVKFLQEARFVYGNASVEDSAHKVAVEKGYLIYCAEEADNGKRLFQLSVDDTSSIEEASLTKEFTALSVKGEQSLPQENVLYSHSKPQSEQKKIKLVPYFYWNNRGVGEMRVWLNRK